MPDGDQLAKMTERMLTPELQQMAGQIQKQLPQGWGFALLIFEFQDNPDDETSLLWVSNAPRDSMLKAMQEFIDKKGGT